MKSILFLTTANLATNPRLLKEVVLLSKDHKVKVIMFDLGNWSDAKTKTLIRDAKALQDVGFTQLPTQRKPLIHWTFWGLLEKLAQMVYPLFKNNFFINAIANSRRCIQLYLKGRRSSERPDFICAHNIGALYPAWRLSKKWNIPFTFDVEDYHPGEFIRYDAKNEKQRREFLMRKLLPLAKGMTSASPLIGEYTMKLIEGHPNHHVVLNSFPENEFIEPYQSNNKNNKLKLVWFSQKISFGRGLEQLFEALQQIEKQQLRFFELTLIGEMDEVFNLQVIHPTILTLGDCFTFNHIHPLAQASLHSELANHDIGLALEFDSADLNRQLCLTNKIIAYAQAGLYILATDTPAQKDFIKKNSWSGQVCGQSVNQIAEALQQIAQKANEVGLKKTERYQLGMSLAWEIESKKLLDTMQLDNKVLKDVYEDNQNI